MSFLFLASWEYRYPRLALQQPYSFVEICNFPYSISSSELFGFLSPYVESQNEEFMLQQLFKELFKNRKCYSEKLLFTFHQIKNCLNWILFIFFFLSFIFTIFFSLFPFFSFSLCSCFHQTQPVGLGREELWHGSRPGGATVWVLAWRGDGVGLGLKELQHGSQPRLGFAPI